MKNLFFLCLFLCLPVFAGQFGKDIEEIELLIDAYRTNPEYQHLVPMLEDELEGLKLNMFRIPVHTLGGLGRLAGNPYAIGYPTRERVERRERESMRKFGCGVPWLARMRGMEDIAKSNALEVNSYLSAFGLTKYNAPVTHLLAYEGKRYVVNQNEFTAHTSGISACGQKITTLVVSSTICGAAGKFIPLACSIGAATTAGTSCAMAITASALACGVSINHMNSLARACKEQSKEKTNVTASMEDMLDPDRNSLFNKSVHGYADRVFDQLTAKGINTMKMNVHPDAYNITSVWD